MPNDEYDSLFDSWGAALNVDPQLAKTVFHTESAGKTDVPDNGGAVGPMQMKPATARAMATKLGFNPDSIDLHDMRWAVPLSMQYLADGMNATQSAEGALGYYSTGSADPSKWNQGYIGKATKLYPSMALTPEQPADDEPQDNSGVVSTANGQIGQNSGTINGFLRQNGQGLDATRANWCAAFVNGVLDANGIEGTQGPGKNVATSFLSWGQQVQGDPQAGDVLVQPRGHPMGGIGGHVGVFAGQIADGPRGPLYLMNSGNYAGKVSLSWEPAGSVVVRRAAPPQSQPVQQAQNQ